MIPPEVTLDDWKRKAEQRKKDDVAIRQAVNAEVRLGCEFSSDDVRYSFSSYWGTDKETCSVDPTLIPHVLREYAAKPKPQRNGVLTGVAKEWIADTGKMVHSKSFHANSRKITVWLPTEKGKRMLA